MADREHGHLSEEAVDGFADRALSPEATIEAQEHLSVCPDCARSLHRAEALSACLGKADVPRLDRDLAPLVVASLQSARASRGRWRWVLAAEAVAGTAVLAAVGLRLGRWIDELTSVPVYAALRQHSLELAAEVSSWLAPFLEFIPSLPTRLQPIRMAVPHLPGPMEAWAGLAVTAMVLGLVGNALLLRAPNGAASHARGEAAGRAEHFGRGRGGGQA